MRLKRSLLSPNRESGGWGGGRRGPLGRKPNSRVEPGREVGESRRAHGRSGLASLVQAPRRHDIGSRVEKGCVEPTIKKRA